MAKYGNASMRTVIEAEIANVCAILAKSNLSEEDKEYVVDAVKEMAHQWCASNASACAMEKAFKDAYPDYDMMGLVNAMMYSGVYEETMKKTCPF